MDKFSTHTGLVVPLDVANVDTDAKLSRNNFCKKLSASVLANTHFMTGAI